ncbi:uncharacterized protein N7482_001833 [Penicillium canariense]|uniref:Uncharacterized protein n=1 Tax=Penicillium canariense TaxID=189055 RepID=A0A9W9LTG5_9EURO|nr:uncharacterized protein N7482_001833 [Penicillium canariense]KAJ5175956.1 hypothetical protein N7482_001833 [Penicillium canariense]
MAFTQIEHFWQASAQVMVACSLLARILRDVENTEVYRSKLGPLIDYLQDLQETVAQRAAEIPQNRSLVRLDVVEERAWTISCMLRGLHPGYGLTAIDPSIRPLFAQQLEKIEELFDNLLLTPAQRRGEELGPARYFPHARLNWVFKIQMAMLSAPWWYIAILDSGNIQPNYCEPE